MTNKKKYKFKVVITDAEYESFEIEKEELNKIGAEVVLGQCKTEDEIIKIAKDADGLLVQYASITRRVIESLQKCKVISSVVRPILLYIWRSLPKCAPPEHSRRKSLDFGCDFPGSLG